jgi:hypothetical protein
MKHQHLWYHVFNFYAIEKSADFALSPVVSASCRLLPLPPQTAKRPEKSFSGLFDL